MSFFKFAKNQIEHIKAFDPSVRSTLEVFYFPSFRALNTWYFSHKLYLHGHYGLARVLSLKAQRKSGIDIHPGAVIGDNLFIDHGMGVVIGETCIIGNNVTIYQQVTLGATGNPVQGRRHPKIEDGAVIGAGSKIIGSITIGKQARIGAGSIIIKDIPAYTTMVPTAAHAVRFKHEKLPVLTMQDLNKKIEQMELCCREGKLQIKRRGPKPSKKE